MDIECRGGISRQVRGLPDEQTGGFINYGGTIVSNLTQNYSPLYQKQSLLNNYLFGIDFTGEQRKNLRDISDGICDAESDLYYFNIPGSTGKFFFKNNGKILLIPFQNLKIINHPSMDSLFTIIDQNGHRHEFSSPDNINSEGQYFNYRTNNYTVWNLIRITDQFNNTIKFKYSLNTTMYYEHYSDDLQFGNETTIKHNYTLTNSTSHYIDSILTSNQKVVFYSNKNRIDIQNEVAIDSIKVFNMNNAVIKTIKFYHSYFIGIPQIDVVNDTNAHKRLRLDKVEIGDQVYTFSYNSTQLPSRYSCSQDAWGYYNGAENATTIANYFAFNDPVIFEGANRCPNPQVIQAGLLTDVIYPTGGKTHYEYEPNQVYTKQFNSLPALVPHRDTSISTPMYDINSDTIINFPFTVKFGDLPYHINTVLYIDSVDWVNRVRIEVVNFNNLVVLNCSPESEAIAPFPPGNYNIRITGLPGAFQHPVYIRIFLNWKTSLFNIEQGSDPLVNKIVGGLRIKNVTDLDIQGQVCSNTSYKYVLESDSTISSGEMFNFPVFSKIINPVFKIWPDCHITYEPYYIPGGPQHQLFSNSAIPLEFNTDGLIGYSTVIKESGSNSNGGKTIYQFTNIKNDPDFKYAQSFDFDTSPYTSVAWLRGLPITEKYFSKSTNGFSLVKKIENFYSKISSIQDSSRCAMGIALLRALPIYYNGTYKWYECSNFVDPESDQVDICFWRPYLTLSGWTTQDSTTLKSYTPTDSIINSSSFKYSDLYWFPDLLLINKSQYCSNGDILKEDFKYPSHFTNLQTGNDFGVKNLQEKHLLQSIIEESSYVKNPGESGFKLVSSNFNAYAPTIAKPKILFQIQNDHLLSDFNPASSSNGNIVIDNRYRTVSTIDSYDGKGNPLQLHRENDINTSYYWAYNGIYPIIKAENIPVETLNSAVNASVSDLTTLLYSIGDLTTEQEKNEWRQFNTTLRNNAQLTNALITTYSYKHLVGITSITDPAGITTYFEYDTQGRLKFERDDKGNILKKYDYHYASH